MSTIKRPRPTYTTHPNVVAGVTVIAYFVLTSLFAWPSTYLFSKVTEADFLDPVSIAGGVALAMIVALVVWKIVRSVFETEMESPDT